MLNFHTPSKAPRTSGGPTRPRGFDSPSCLGEEERERERERECGKKRRRCRKQPKVPCPSRLCLLSHCLIGDKPGRACPARFPEKAAEKPTEFRSRRVSLESRRVAQARRGITGAFSTRPAEYPWSAHFQRSRAEYPWSTQPQRNLRKARYPYNYRQDGSHIRYSSCRVGVIEKARIGLVLFFSFYV